MARKDDDRLKRRYPWFPTEQELRKCFWTGRSRGGAHCTTKVWTQLSGYNPSNLKLEPTGELQPEHYHCLFDPNFQRYAYDRLTHELVITHTSPKMGAYRVTIYLY